MYLITENTFKTKFELNKPNKLYDIDEHKYLPWIEQASIYIFKYLLEITDNEKNNLIKHKLYVRFMCYQDSPLSKAYMRAYCRPIHEMTLEHYEEALIMLEMNPPNTCLGEINYHKGQFFTIKLE